MTMKTVLEDSQLFRLLDEHDRAILADMAIRRTYAEGEQVFGEHEQAYGICILLEGRIALQLDLGGNRRLTIGTVDPGEMFAWSGLVPPFTFTSAARALTACEIAVLPSEDLRRTFDDNPPVGYRVMQQVSELVSLRLRDVQLQLVGLFGA